MPYVPISVALVAPNTAEPDTFNDDADQWAADIIPWTAQVNAAGVYIDAVGVAVDADALSASGSASAASGSAASALTSQNLAAASANYKGLWSAQTGAANKPYSVFHNGSFWALNNNLANVTTSTPSLTNADWQFVSGTRWQAVQTTAFTTAKNALYPVTATAATLDVTLPAFTVGDFFVIANNPASTQLMRIVKSGVTVTNSLGLVVASGDNITYRAGQIFRAYAISSTALVVY
jgi:flagellar capping protein FliD